MTNYLSGESVAGGKMKSSGTTYWTYPNTAATNESGFSALPGGFRNIGGRFNSIRDDAWFWSVTEYDKYDAWARHLSNGSGDVGRRGFNFDKSVGASVRCISN